MKTIDAAALRRFIYIESRFLRELQGQRSPVTFNKILGKALRLRAGEERKALLYWRNLPAPSRLDTEDPYVDDELLAAVVQIRAGKPRWEAAWHLSGDIRVAPDRPLVFVNNRFVPGSAGFDEDGVAYSLWRNYAHCLTRRPTLCIDRAILLRDFWDYNYWHLHHDILPRLVMADALDLDPTIPIVVSARMMNCHATLLSDTSFLKKRPVIIQQDNHTLCTKELFLLRPGEFARHWTANVVARIPSDFSSPLDSRHIYCRRVAETSAGRTAENSLEIEEIFRSAGFVVVDPASMTLNRQKAIFERAEVIAGLNGAAFANAVFRNDKPLTIGALVPSHCMTTTFPTMAKVYGFRYVGFVVPSKAEDRFASVQVPPETAKRLIECLLERSSISAV